MFLSDAELAMCNELGINPSTGQEMQGVRKTANLKYVGFNRYVSAEDGKVFEKVGSDFSEVVTPELEAEQRYLKSKR